MLAYAVQKVSKKVGIAPFADAMVAQRRGTAPTLSLNERSHSPRLSCEVKWQQEPKVNLMNRIQIDPAVCHGQPCVRGTRIPVWLIIQYFANEDTVDQVVAAYPTISHEDIKACLAYAAELTRERVVPVEVAR